MSRVFPKQKLSSLFRLIPPTPLNTLSFVKDLLFVSFRLSRFFFGDRASKPSYGNFRDESEAWVPLFFLVTCTTISGRFVEFGVVFCKMDGSIKVSFPAVSLKASAFKSYFYSCLFCCLFQTRSDVC